MAISPENVQDLAVALRGIYSEAEVTILEKIASRLSSGINDDSWQVKKLRELRTVQQQVENIISELSKNSLETVQGVITESYMSGLSSAEFDLISAGIDVSPLNGLTSIHTAAINALVGDTIGILKQSHLHILRSTMDGYRRAIAETTSSVLAGTETRRQATQRALNKMADTGISGFTDKAGRNWDLASYAEMATRTAASHAAIEGHLTRMTDNGRDLVIVSDHREECSICRPWERKILSISGTNDNYPSVAQARSAGLWHANCGHTINAYIPGLTEVGTPHSDPNGYAQRQQQRQMERSIRHWKRREAVAITDEEKAKASVKVRQWQGAMRNFIDDTGRKRNSAREQLRMGTAGISRPNLPELDPVKAKPKAKKPPKPKDSWKPEMTEKQANEWAKDSVFKGDFFHGTSKTKAEKIRKDGFRTDLEGSGQVFGKGVYVTGKREETEYWTQDLSFKDVEVLRTRVNVKNPKMFDLTDGDQMDMWKSLRDEAKSNASKSGNSLPVEITNLLKSKGYDSLLTYHHDVDWGGDQLVVFDPKNITVIK